MSLSLLLVTSNLRCRFLRSGADVGGRSSTERLDSLLLSSVGALVAHQTAYSLAPLLGDGALISHGHLGFLWKLSFLTAVLGMTGVVLRSVRSRSYRIASPIGTGVTIAASFTLMEALERLVEGVAPSALATEVVFWLGLSATIPVTLIYTYVLRTVAEVAGKFLERRTAPDWPSIVPSINHRKRVFSLGQPSHSRSLWDRGPPPLNVSSFHN